MSQLVGEKRPPALCMGGKLSGAEYNVAANRIGQCVDRAGRFRCPLIGVHPDAAEIVAKSRLEKGSEISVQGPSGRTQRVVNAGRSERTRPPRFLCESARSGPLCSFAARRLTVAAL